MNYVWQDEIQWSLDGNPNTINDSYGIAGMNLGIRSKEGTYQVMAFVNNVFKKRYALSIGDSSGLFPGQGLVLSHNLARDYGRYAGIRLKYKC